MRVLKRKREIAMKIGSERSPIRVEAAFLAIVLGVCMIMPQMAMADMISLYATDVRSSEWAWPARAEGAPQGVAGSYAYSAWNEQAQHGWLDAKSWDAWTLPVGQHITNVTVGIHTRWWSFNRNGPIKLQEYTYGGDTGWLTLSGNLWQYFSWDITSKQAEWTKAEVDAVEVGVMRRYFDDPVADLCVDAFEMRVTYVPEPGAFCLFIISGLTVIRRRRRQYYC